MKTTLPGRPPDADADPEALIREARRRQHRRYLAVGLAIVVLLAVAAGVTVSVTGPGGHAPGRQAAPRGQTRPASAVPAYAEGGRVPPYYVFTWSNLKNPSGADVRLTATGATIATVQPTAADSTIVGVTGAPDDRTFILDERTLKPQRNPVVNAEPHTFYRLRLSASGRPSSVTRLPVTEPNGVDVTGFALSPDGTEFAVAVDPDGNVRHTALKIYSTATGAVLRSWSATGTIGSAPSALEDAEGLSWISDQAIGFTWAGVSGGFQQSVRLLNLRLGGNNLLDDSRQLMYLGPGSSPGCQELIVTPDGSAVVCAMLVTLATGPQLTGKYSFVDYPTAAGMPVRTLAHGTVKNLARWFADVLWSNPSGSVLIGVIPASGGPTHSEIGMITAGKFTPLPGRDLGESLYAAAAW
jgi:hypothetical protein